MLRLSVSKTDDNHTILMPRTSSNPRYASHNDFLKSYSLSSKAFTFVLNVKPSSLPYGEAPCIHVALLCSIMFIAWMTVTSFHRHDEKFCFYYCVDYTPEGDKVAHYFSGLNVEFKFALSVLLCITVAA